MSPITRREESILPQLSPELFYMLHRSPETERDVQLEALKKFLRGCEEKVSTLRLPYFSSLPSSALYQQPPAPFLPSSKYTDTSPPPPTPLNQHARATCWALLQEIEAAGPCPWRRRQGRRRSSSGCRLETMVRARDSKQDERNSGSRG